MITRILFILTLTLGLVVSVAHGKTAEPEAKELTIAYVEWDCATASTNLVKAILEDRLGYTVNALPVTLPIMWASIVTGDADVTMSAWLPETNKFEYAKVKDDVELLGKLTSGARIGLVVPDYVPLRSIDELRANSAKFNNTIVGIDSGSATFRLTEELVKAYDLPMEIIDGSGATMTAALRDAIRREEWVVVTGWSPHWMFGRWKLHYLDDPKNIYGQQENIYSMARKDFKDRHPVVHAFLKRMAFESVDQFQTYMNYSQEDGATPESSAHRFIKENPALIADWLKTD